jgi:hypothetical protein
LLNFNFSISFFIRVYDRFDSTKRAKQQYCYGCYNSVPHGLTPSFAVAEAEFFAASAGAGLIGSMLLVLGSDPCHDLGGCVALLNHLGHSREGWAGMHEK